ncbi:MAG: hypothetical protein K2H76_02975, partial [Muribaculaceae bacterium]|nr:hypothetical protein [Muribaculaceae bacterium]
MTCHKIYSRILIWVGMVAAATMAAHSLHATEKSSIKIDKTLFYRQKAVPNLVDNYQYLFFYANANKLYNLKGYEVASASMPIMEMKLNPAGHSIAVIMSNGKSNSVATYDINAQRRRLAQVKDFSNPKAIEYTADSR